MNKCQAIHQALLQTLLSLKAIGYPEPNDLPDGIVAGIVARGAFERAALAIPMQHRTGIILQLLEGHGLRPKDKPKETMDERIARLKQERVEKSELIYTRAMAGESIKDIAKSIGLSASRTRLLYNDKQNKEWRKRRQEEQEAFFQTDEGKAWAEEQKLIQAARDKDDFEQYQIEAGLFPNNMIIRGKSPC